jgi:hypothetical protein
VVRPGRIAPEPCVAEAAEARKGMPELSHTELLELLSYDAATGEWRARVATKKRKIGDRVESRGGPGYLAVFVAGRQFLAHRLAWFYMTGTWPRYIDHRDRNPTNNKWENLRECDQHQNGGNSKHRKNNVSGHKGVYWEPKRKRWHAQIKLYRKSIFLGRFKEKEEAIATYKEAAQRFFGEFARYA